MTHQECPFLFSKMLTSLFAQFCREVGLNDIHLFSPSDLVEGKDVRRVCVCLRTLSSRVKDAVVRPAISDVEIVGFWSKLLT